MGSLFKKTQSIKTIFFDIGGVVVTAPMTNYLRIGSELFESTPENLQRLSSELVPLLEKGEIQSGLYWEKLSLKMEETGQGKNIPAWRFKGFWEGILTDVLKVNNDVVDLVRRLKAHVRVAVLSNVIEEHAVVLKKEGVYEHFNPVILSCQIGARKPDREAFAKAGELAKTPLERCLLVDDCEHNIAAAEKFGLQTIHFTSFEDFHRRIYEMGFFE